MSTGTALIQQSSIFAMNSEIVLLCPARDAASRFERAERWLEAFEERASRFRSTSEVYRLNQSSGRPITVSPLLSRLLSISLDFARLSGGLFDPTVLRHLESAGYDHSFDVVETSGIKRTRALSRPDTGSTATWRDVYLDPATRTVRLPQACGIDLGGIGKGWAVDRMASILGASSLVDGGGDIYAAGQPPDAPAWLIGVQNPWVPENDLVVVAVRDRGVATSSVMRRSWPTAGANAHHLIDTRTGRPASSDACQATVIASTAVLADYHAKVALLKGVREGVRYLEAQADVEGIVFGQADGSAETSGLQRYLAR